VFKKFILGSLLVAGLTACPIVDPPVDPPIVNPKAIADTIEFTTSQSIKPAINDVKGSADLVDSTIDLDVNTPNQQTFWDDVNKLGRFTLDTKTGTVSFKPAIGKNGNGAVASYRIKDSSGNESNIAKINVTVTPVVTGPIKVLFIGNSRTKYESCVSGFATYNIPTMLRDISVASTESRKIEPTVVTDCGKYLKQHYDDGNFAGRARGFLALGGWEYVVLQAHTNEVDATLRSTVQLFQTEIQRTNPNAKIILYENWRKLGITQQINLTPVFEGVASSLTIKLAPVGRAWVRSGLTDNQLFNGDGELIHATPLGAYTAASTFYWMIYKKDVPAVGVPSGLFGLDAAARTGARNAYTDMNSNFK
jgi:Surface adhesin CshA repetitive domain